MDGHLSGHQLGKTNAITGGVAMLLSARTLKSQK